MKLRLSSRHPEQGNVLIVSLCTMMIIGIALITYLQLAKNQNQLVFRSQVWNACLPVAEAGLDDALNHVAWNSSNMTLSGWALSATNTYWRTNSIGEGWYSVSITTNLAPAYIIATGYWPMPGSPKHVSRTVKVSAVKVPPYKFAMKTKGGITMKGNGNVIDSFDSTDPTKSTGGMYDAAKAGDEADVFLLGKNGTADIGNGNIWGHAYVFPGTTVKVGSNGKIGSAAWNKSSSKGIQPGWTRTDANMSIPDAVVPFSGGVPPLPGIVGGTLYSAVLDDGVFQTPTLTGKVIVTGNAMIHVTGDINVSTFVIQTNCTVSIYCGGTTATFNTINNRTRSSTALLYFGLPANTTINLNDPWMGAVYAPNADFLLHGNPDFIGSLVAKTATLKGNSAFHFDVALSKAKPGQSLVITSWTEL